MISMANIFSQAVSIAPVTNYYVRRNQSQLPEDTGKFLFVRFAGGRVIHTHYLPMYPHGGGFLLFQQIAD